MTVLDSVHHHLSLLHGWIPVTAPADWIRIGNAVSTVDAFAAEHGGNTPMLVFVDAGGTLNNDTECVNGSRGNAADHLTKGVVPFIVSNFHVSAQPTPHSTRPP